MKVLIGITTHNRAAILPRAIQSALDQDYSSKVVAVFDDASTDETPHLREQYPQVHWYRTDCNEGLIRARNHLMEDTDADYYFSLDDDAWFLKGDEISTGAKILDERLEVAALAYDILSPDRHQSTERTSPSKTHSIIGCGHMLRLSAARSVGFYTPGPGPYGSEEQDLCIRLLDERHEILFLPGVNVWHDRTMLARNSYSQHASGVCNDLTFAFRRSPASILIWLLPGKLISHLRFAAAHDLIRPCLKGIGAFFRELPDLRCTRRPVRAKVYKEFRRRQHSVL
jgi:glycosyltransferase involved in cell wall biosynthesis